jgi:hypothetical protein
MPRLLISILVTTAILSAFAVGAEEPVDALHYAKGAANWILSIAKEQDGVLTWPVNDTDKKAPAFDLYYGMPGGILLLAELAKEDPLGPYAKALPASVNGLESLRVEVSIPVAGMKNTRFEGARGWAWGTLEGSTLKTPSGLYSGLSGIAWLYLELYRSTGEPRYLDGARSAVETILDRGVLAIGPATWDNSTDIISGAAGIGLLLLRAAAVLKNPRCVPRAESAGTFLLNEAIQTPAGLKWKINAGASVVYPNFAHGTAGIAYFLVRLSDETGGLPFLNAALKGAAELQLDVEEDPKQTTCTWFHHEEDGENLWYVSWCHGPAGTARLFYALSQSKLSKAQKRLTGLPPARRQATKSLSERPMDWVDCAANWLLNSGIPEPKKPINGYWNEGLCCGTAGVGEFFVDLYLATKKPEYLRAAERMAQHLAAAAVPAGSGYRWIQAEDRVSPQKKDAQTGYAQGAAGIGLFFLKLSRAQRGVPIGWHLPDNPF